MGKQLKSFEDIFGDHEETTVTQKIVDHKPVQLKIEQLRPYAKRRFSLYTEERLDDMVESIRQNGILQPVLVRSLLDEPDQYEILAGHNRINAAKKAGLSEVPGYVLDNLSDEAAEIYYFETNLMQRSFADLSHSEKATVLAARHLKMFSQGKRNDILAELKELENLGVSTVEATCAQIGHKLKSREKIGREYGLSKNSIARYLRIDQLVDELKQYVDDGTIPLNAGVDISYLAEEEQRDIGIALEENTYTVDLKKSGLLKQYAQQDKLTTEMIHTILAGTLTKKPKTVGLRDYKVNKTVLKKYFSEDTSKKEIEETIQKALDLYFEHQ